jgi:hypothetical protein
MLFSTWMNYLLPNDELRVRRLTEPDAAGECYGAAVQAYKGVIPLSIWCYTPEQVLEKLRKKPLIVTTDLRFPNQCDDLTQQTGIDFILEHRHLSPDTHYLFHAIEFSDRDKARLKEHGFDNYFVWKALGKGEWGTTAPEDKAEAIFLQILSDYAEQISKDS